MGKQLSQAKVGQRVLVWVARIASNQLSVRVGPSVAENHFTIPATVVHKTVGKSGRVESVFLGWLYGEECPCEDFFTTNIVDQGMTIAGLDWKAEGYVQVHEYGSHCEYEEIIDGAPILQGRQEKPCKQCHRPNDLGVSSCWWCGVQGPTK